MKVNIAAVNLQSGVATTRSRFQYALTGWKYWLPHSDAPIRNAGKMLDRENVDIACVTEITERSLRSGFRSQLETLSENAGLSQRHFFSSQRLGKIFFHEGNALLTKHRIAHTASHLLHREFNMRMALDQAAVQIGNVTINVCVVHLALTKKHRQIQLKQIVGILNGRKDPFILAGDFNSRDTNDLDIILKETPLVYDCSLKTFPSWHPTYPFDHIFLSREFSPLDCYIPMDPPFSDHAALLVRAELSM